MEKQYHRSIELIYLPLVVLRLHDVDFFVLKLSPVPYVGQNGLRIGA
jgi:hypothetical protein